VLEIGCGTGQATLPFARLGVRLLAIDPGDHLLDLARTKLNAYPRVAFRNCFFEDAQLEPESFDLVISATAFHWIPSQIAYPKTAQVLKPGGTLALFWNMMPTFEDKIEAQLRAMFDYHAPGLGDSSFGQGSKRASDEGLEEIRASGHFTMIERDCYEWSLKLSGPDFCRLLSTFGNFQALSPDIQSKLFDALEAWIHTDLGDVIKCQYETILHLCKRREELCITLL
jgi:SAM-dependent methyltransferase